MWIILFASYAHPQNYFEAIRHPIISSTGTSVCVPVNLILLSYKSTILCASVWYWNWTLWTFLLPAGKMFSLITRGHQKDTGRGRGISSRFPCALACLSLDLQTTTAPEPHGGTHLPGAFNSTQMGGFPVRSAGISVTFLVGLTGVQLMSSHGAGWPLLACTPPLHLLCHPVDPSAQNLQRSGSHPWG